MRRRTVLLAATVVGAAGVAGGEAATRWVQRTKADIRSGRGSYHAIVDTLVKGEPVQVLRSEAGWLFVETPRRKQGWIFEAVLADKPVGKGVSDFLRLVPGDASTSTTAASVGAKGIYAEQYAKQKGFDYSVVTWVEQNQPSAGEIDAFVREGGLRAPGAAGAKGSG